MKGKKNYLVAKLTSDENLYLKKVVINRRNRYIRDNYNNIYSTCSNLSEIKTVEDYSVLDVIIEKCENEINSAVEFEKVMSDDKLYNIVKALSLKEKIVLFSLYKENKSINKTAEDMKISRETVWRIKNRALDKIARNILGGGKNV